MSYAGSAGQLQYTRIAGTVAAPTKKHAIIVEDIAAVIEAFGPPEAKGGDFVWSFVSEDGAASFSVRTKIQPDAENVELVLSAAQSSAASAVEEMCDWFGDTIQATVCGYRAPAFIFGNGRQQFVISEMGEREAA